MAFISSFGTAFTTPLMNLMNCTAIEPGSETDYQLCKTIYEFHPLGAKLAEAPIKIAQSQKRLIAIQNGPEDRVRDQFQKIWDEIGADGIIFNVVKLARIYGIASVVMMVEGADPKKEIDFETFWQKRISFNVYDPLNTAGSLVYNQNPNAFDFLKNNGTVTVQGVTYPRSATAVFLNEEPIYLGWTNSAFGYVGRSVYQRTLYPLKSFLASMKTDDMVARKAGVIIAKIKAAGSVVNAAMEFMAGFKRNILKEAETDNVINIDPDEDVASINLENVNGAMSESRKNILNNIASGAGMPAVLVNEETFAEGFGEGTEDAKLVAMYIEQFRKDIQPLYDYFDLIVMHRAWNEEFFKTMQAEFPEEYAGKNYKLVFAEWKRSFQPVWPSLITEPESEKAKKDDIRLKAIIAFLEVILSQADPDNKAILIQWAQDNLNTLEDLFPIPLVLDVQALAEYEPPVPEMGADGAQADGPPKPPRPMTDAAQGPGGPAEMIARAIRAVGKG